MVNGANNCSNKSIGWELQNDLFVIGIFEEGTFFSTRNLNSNLIHFVRVMRMISNKRSQRIWNLKFHLNAASYCMRRKNLKQSNFNGENMD